MSLIIVIIQTYEAEADNEYVIKGNSAIMKCEIPSFVADFVIVDSWIDSNDQEYYREDNTSTWWSISTLYFCHGRRESLLNLPIEFCLIAVLYFDSSVRSHFFPTVVAQFYETRVVDEFVLRGNSVIMKCNLPSFVADFVNVEAWISTDDGEVVEYYANNTKWGI